MNKIEEINIEAIQFLKIKQKLTFQVNYSYINRLFMALDFNQHQKQGRDPKAGMKHVSVPSGTGRDMSRQPRGHVGNKSFGGQRVVRVPNAVGGRACFPINVNKNIKTKLNKKERKLGYLHLFSYLVQNVEFKFMPNLECKIKDLKEFYDINKKVLYLYSNYDAIKNIKNIKNLKLLNISSDSNNYNKLYNLGPINKNYEYILYSNIADLQRITCYLLNE